MNFTHEVEYVFEYEEEEYRENYYRDSLEGRRYKGRTPNDLSPTNLKATGRESQIIKPTLLGSKVLNEQETLLVYDAPDIDKIIILFIVVFPDGGKIWGYKNGILYYDKIEGIGGSAK